MKFITSLRFWALICVFATSLLFGYLAIHLIDILQSPDWCARAIQADRITPGSTFVGLTGCMDLLKMQVGSLAKALLIVIGTFALCLGTLVVIVVAGARLAGKIFGNDINISRDRDPASQAAKQVAGAAVDEAKNVVEQNQ